MRDPHGRVGRVDRLPARAGGAVDVDLQVVLVDLDLDVLGLGQHRDGRRRGVDAALRLGLRHALHAVRAALELEDRVGAVALDLERVRAVGGAQRLGLEAAPLGVAGEHPVEVAGPQAGLVAAGAAADLDDHVLVVVGVALDHREPDLLLELARSARARPRAPRASRRPRRPRRAAPARPRRRTRAPPLLGELRGRRELVEERARRRRSAARSPITSGSDICACASAKRASICSTSDSIMARSESRRRPPCRRGPRRTRRAGPRRRARPPARRSRPRAASRSGSRVVSFCSCMPGQMISLDPALAAVAAGELDDLEGEAGDQRHAEDPRGEQACTRPAGRSGRRRRWRRSSRSSRKLVPQRGCRREKRCAFSGVSGRPAS